MRHLILLAPLLAFACASSPLPGGSDGSAALDDGGATMSDLRGGTCADVASAVGSWIHGNLSCQSDSDCRSVYTACGLEGQCGVIANLNASGSYLTSLVDSWNKMGCATPCACPLWDPAPGCNAGVCGNKMTTGNATVGAPCKSNLDCMGLDCGGDAEGFPGGYCTVRDCNVRNMGCPPGSTCKVGPNGRSFCLLDCKLQSQCRPDYGCCSGPGPTTGAGWCSPKMSFLCTAH